MKPNCTIHKRVINGPLTYCTHALNSNMQNNIVFNVFIVILIYDKLTNCHPFKTSSKQTHVHLTLITWIVDVYCTSYGKSTSAHIQTYDILSVTFSGYNLYTKNIVISNDNILNCQQLSSQSKRHLKMLLCTAQ